MQNLPVFKLHRIVLPRLHDSRLRGMFALRAPGALPFY